MLHRCAGVLARGCQFASDFRRPLETLQGLRQIPPVTQYTARSRFRLDLLAAVKTMSASDIWIRAGQKVFPGSFFPLFRRVYKVNLPAKKDKATMTPTNLLTIHRKPRSLVAPEQCSGGDLQRSWPLVLLALGCFALCPVMQAVVPVPDGAYPGGKYGRRTRRPS